MQIECVLRHDGRDWVATNDALEARGRTLEELDAAVAECLHGVVPGGGRASVLMTFDNSQIPEWIRQYGQHYFNREITVPG